MEEHKIGQNESRKRKKASISSRKQSIKQLVIMFVVAILMVLALVVFLALGECSHKNIIAATCESDAFCEKYEEKTASALGHEYKVTRSIAPTCVESGINYLTCSRCSETITEKINVIAHEGTETILQEPTPLYEGKIQIECDMCGQIIEEMLHPLSVSSDHPIVLTDDELLDAVENDIDKAKKLYKGRWLQLTGKVVSVTHNEIGHYTRTEYGKTTSWTTGEEQYIIDGITIKSALIYWMNDRAYADKMNIVIEMDTSLCFDPEKDVYVYYPQHSTVTVVAYCAAIGEDDIVLTNGRYPPE